MRTFLLILSLLLFTTVANSQKIPQQPSPPRLVNDFGDVLTDQQERQLEQKLLRYHDTTSSQITIVVLDEELQDDPNLFAAELGQKWGVGQRGADNGLVFLVAPKGKNRHIAIQNGYGLEPVLTDAATRMIIERHVLPEFRNDNYYQGIEKGTDQIIKLLAGEFTGTGQRSRQEDGHNIPAIVIMLIVLVVFGFISRRGGRSGGYRSRGGGVWIGGMGGGGFGGSGGGGGFGGFGGGSFGGGGASGSW